MRILVTGATGFMGSHLVDALAKKEHDVNVLVRKTSNTQYIQTHLKNDEIKLIYGDLGDLDSLKTATKDIDVVYHTAAFVRTDIYDYKAEKLLEKINVEGTRNLLEACLLNDVKKVVHFSSVAAIGHAASFVDEKTPCNPMDPYGKSKLDNEKFAMGFYKKNGLPVTIIRPSTVYGPRDTNTRIKFFQNIKNGKIRIIGDGTNKMPFVYVDDIVNGGILAGENKNSTGEIYILSSKQSYPMEEIIKIIADELNVKQPSRIPIWFAYVAGFASEIISKISKNPPILSGSKVKILTRDYSYDISKAKMELGYKPSVDLKEGISKTVRWYKTNGYL
jgi:nucleoside-diphosphate-sugar epimerase